MNSNNLTISIIGLALLYFLLRIIFLIIYLSINAKANKEADIEYLEYCEEMERCKSYYRFRLYFPPPIRLPSRKTQEKWDKIFKIDKKIKSLGTISLSILSIAFIIYSPEDNNKTLLLVSALLPPLINLFNDVMSWFEIDDPIFHKPTLPVRFLAKHGDKKHQMNRDDYLEYLKNNSEENIDPVRFDKFCKDKLHKK